MRAPNPPPTRRPPPNTPSHTRCVRRIYTSSVVSGGLVAHALAMSPNPVACGLVSLALSFSNPMANSPTPPSSPAYPPTWPPGVLGFCIHTTPVVSGGPNRDILLSFCLKAICPFPHTVSADPRFFRERYLSSPAPVSYRLSRVLLL